MKKILVFLISLGISMVIITNLVSQKCLAVGSSDTIINVNPNQDLGTISSNLYGINHRYYDDGVGMYDPTTGKAFDTFSTTYNDLGLTSLRYPGGTVANTFTWKRTIGSMNTREQVVHSHIMNLSPQTVTFGVDEAAQFCERHNTEMVYVYNMGNGNTQDCADLIEYLNGINDGSNLNGGTDWAKVRAENGHPEPYNVKSIEIGNEMYIPGQYYWLLNSTSTSMAKNYALGGNFKYLCQPAVLKSDWRNNAANSNGKPNQVKYVRYDNVIENSVTLKVGGVSTWNRVDDLEQYGPNDKVYEFDYKEGKITFGDGVNGKIPLKGLLVTVTYTSHRDGYVDYYNTIKSIDPTIKVYSCYHNDNFINVMGNKYLYDGVVVHPYAQFMFPHINIDDYHDMIMHEADKQLISLRDLKATIQNKVSIEQTDNINLVASEYGILSNNAPTDGYLYSLDHGLFVAKYLMGFMKLGIEQAQKHCLIDVAAGNELGPGGQAIISSKPNFTKSATAYALKMFTHMFGSMRVSSSITNNPVRTINGNGKLEKLEVVASKDNNGNIYLMVVNVDRSDDVTTTINLDEFNATGDATIWTLNSLNYTDYNSDADPCNVVIQESTIKAENHMPYTFPAHSITAIKISGTIMNNTTTTQAALAVYNFNNETNGVISDITANGYDATLKNGANIVIDNSLNGVVTLTKSSDFVRLPFITDLSVSNMTVAAMVKLDTALNAKQIIIQQRGQYGRTWLYRKADGRLASFIGGTETVSVNRIPVNEWVFVTAVKDNNTVKLYINGKLEGSHTSPVCNISIADMSIGRHKTPAFTEKDWIGEVDDVSIYDTALSDKEIFKLYQTITSPNN